MSSSNDHKSRASILTGSAFLMATSAIGPGFITQTTVFTNSLGTSFGFVILCSVILDIIVQLNIWRVVSVSGMRAHALANKFFPGTGHLLTVLIVAGGLAFNIGNVAGAALGMEAMFDLPMTWGVAISVVISLYIFWYPDAGKAMDFFSRIMGLILILLTLYIVFLSSPPLAEAGLRTIVPERIDTTAIIVLVGGTVGGYISFAGVHRLIDAGVTGAENVSLVSRAAVKGILIASLMRVLLFLAALGIIYAGGVLDPGNPAASVFRHAAGGVGYRIFGVVLWAAAITSVVGSAYTSVSFLKGPFNLAKTEKPVLTVFLLVSAAVYLVVGRPVKILVIVGALNAFVLPIALTVILMVARKKVIREQFNQPGWLVIAGWIAAALLLVMGARAAMVDLPKLWE